jgi:hypothetical protein
LAQDFEIRLRNKLTRRAVSRECADWIKSSTPFQPLQCANAAIWRVFQEKSPQKIYFVILYHILSEFLEEISEDVLPWRPPPV